MYYIPLLLALGSLYGSDLANDFKARGYSEICDKDYTTSTFDSLYESFEELIQFLQTNRGWAQKLMIAKEQFIRSSDRNYYGTDFFGFYDESNRKGRDQISFYYSAHFHQFVSSHFPEFNEVPEISSFLESCFRIQKTYGHLFIEAAFDLNLETLFMLHSENLPPLLFKVIKYLPSYIPTRPHYDGSALTLFLHSTDNQSLLLSPYKSSFTIADFSSPSRKSLNQFGEPAMVLIPGSHLTEFSLFPTPHIVVQSNKTRYATVAFAMRADYKVPKTKFSLLPKFTHN